MMELERLLRIPFVDVDGGFDLAPDGRRLAFSSNSTGQWEIYGMDLHLPENVLRLSSGPGAKVGPRYSPDGSWLAFVVDFDGSENYHLFIHALHRGRLEPLRSESRDLTPGIESAIQPNFCFSPDGEKVVFLSDATGCFGAYVIPSTGGEATLLLENGLPAWDVAWSPDGRHLAVMNEGSGQDYYIHIISLEHGDTIPVADRGERVNAHNPAWSPDGARLAFHSDAPNGFHQIGVFDLDTRRISWLTNGNANCRSPKWSKEGGLLTYIRAHGASDRVVVQGLHGAAREFQVETGVHYKPRFTPDGEGIIFAFNNFRHPPGLWMLTIESGTLIQLSPDLPDDLKNVPLALPEEITYPGLDGTPVPALLFRSETAGSRTPAVIMIHGGPNWHFQIEWYPLMLHLAGRGFTVLAPNYRGSTGYGREWQYANRFDMGGVDTDDVVAGARYLLDARIADSARIAVTGQSHGGYLTMSCLTRYPDLWCAGSAVVPFLNWFTGHANSRADLQHWDIENFGDPVKNHDLWYERSPFFFLDRVRVPVQMICGENDPRCPASESIQARDQLVKFGREVDLVLYRGEGHSLWKTENLTDAELRRGDFLSRALTQPRV